MTRDKDRPRRPFAERTIAREPAPIAAPASAPSQPTRQRIASPPPPERQRIAKVIARAGLCSRRDAEAWIVEGRVAVNGAVLTSPAVDVGPDDAVVVDGAPLPVAEKTRLFLFHKPRGLVTSDHDPEGRETVAGFLREHWPEGPRVVTIGRLDINTEGLLLLTNDGGLARVLELPKTGWVRRYRVRAKGETDQGVLDTLRDGVSLDGIDYAGIEATLDRSQGANCWLTMGLREGKNREIKRVLEHLGLEVNRLIRLSFGPFQLLDLAEGQVEEVRTRILRDQLGERIAAEAGVSFEVAEAAAPPPESRRSDEPRRPPPKTAATRNGAGAPRERRVGASQRPPRPGRDARQWDKADEPDAKPRERPAAGTRKHISTLRADRSEAPAGPRRRIERSDTKDRRDRTVTVERVVSSARASDDREPGAGRRGAARFATSERTRASPSALAKRERVAKSGGPRDGAAGEREARDDAPRRADARGPGQRGKNDQQRATPRADARSTREQANERGDRKERAANRPQAERSRSFREGAEKPSKPTRASPSRESRGAVASKRFDEAPRRASVTRRDGGKPSSGKFASGKPSFGKTSSGKPASGKPGFGKPGFDKTSSGKPGFDKPARGKPGTSRAPARSASPDKGARGNAKPVGRRSQPKAPPGAPRRK